MVHNHLNVIANDGNTAATSPAHPHAFRGSDRQYLELVQRPAKPSRADSNRWTGARQRRTRAPRLALGTTQVVWLLYEIVATLLGLRLLLVFVGASRGTLFGRVLNRLTDTVMMPFDGLLPLWALPRRLAIDGSIIAAVLVYLLLAVSVARMLRVFQRR